jgi:hypothetical protein
MLFVRNQIDKKPTVAMETMSSDSMWLIFWLLAHFT